MKKYENTIKLICEKREGHVNGADIYNDIEQATTPEIADQWLLGFLRSKETLIAVFGEEERKIEGYGYSCWFFSDEYPKPDNEGDTEWHNYSRDVSIEEKEVLEEKAKKLKPGHDGYNPTFEPIMKTTNNGYKYHAQKMGYTLEEILDYYEKYLWKN